MKKYISLVVLSLAIEAFGVFSLLYEINPFQYYFYVTSWWSYIILADTVFAFRNNRFLILNRRLPLLLLISSGFWCLFELINVRLHNWHYINLPSESVLRYIGYLLSYGTVIPAIMVTKGLLDAFLPSPKKRGFHIKKYPLCAVSAGVGSLILVFTLPSFAFALTWIFLALILDGINYRQGYYSFMKDLEAGLSKNLISTCSSGFMCGLLWEAWNFGAVSKWIYTVPFLETFKLFEMPLPGYIGFPAFGVETITFVSFLRGISGNRESYYIASAIGVALSLVSFPLIDHYTVLSFVPVLYH